jgi:hypothetical protein
MSGAQRQGAALTYGRRQSLEAVLGLTTSDDVDGAGRAQPITPEQIKEINDLATEILDEGIEFEWNRFLDWLGVEALDDLEQDDFPKALRALERKLEKGKKGEK